MLTIIDYTVPSKHEYTVDRNSPYREEFPFDNSCDYTNPFASYKLNRHSYVYLDNQLIVTVPTELSPLFNEIIKSKYILNLGNDWDDEGSIGYKKETWIEAIKFTVKYALWVKDQFGQIIFTPNIYHGRNGGIDILWDNEGFRMLIRIDCAAIEAVFYSENKKGQTTEGNFSINDVNFFMIPAPISA